MDKQKQSEFYGDKSIMRVKLTGDVNMHAWSLTILTASCEDHMKSATSFVLFSRVKSNVVSLR